MAAAEFFSCRDKSRCQFSNKGAAASVEHLFDVCVMLRDGICKCVYTCLIFQFIF